MAIKKRSQRYLTVTYISAAVFWLLVLTSTLISHYFGSHQPAINKVNGADLIVTLLGIAAIVVYVVGVCSTVFNLFGSRKRNDYLNTLVDIVLLFGYFMVFYLNIN